MRSVISFQAVSHVRVDLYFILSVSRQKENWKVLTKSVTYVKILRLRN